MEMTKQFFEINFIDLAIGIIAAMAGITAIVGTISLFFDKVLKKPFGFWKKISSDHELLVETVKGLERLCDNREKDLKNIREDNVVWREHSIKVQEKYDERFKKLDKVKEQTEQFIENEKTKKLQIDSLTIALKELLAAKINEKYKHYIYLKGIPEDEVDEFTSLHFAYKSCGGNHHGDAKYNYVMKNLPVIPVETKLVYDRENDSE